MHAFGRSLSQKSQAGRVLDILGVTFDLSKGRPLILEDRKTRILMEIDQILFSGVLSPGQAGKLRGKLLFISGLFSGRHDRCHLRPLADRQFAIGGSNELTAPRLCTQSMEEDLAVQCKCQEYFRFIFTYSR